MGFTKAEYQQIFEKSVNTPFDNAHEAHWVWVTKEVLGLDVVRYLEAVHETIKQGRWRNADDPRSYVKTVAKREAKKMEIANYPDEHLHLYVPDLRDEDGHPLSHDDYIDYLSYDGPVVEGGTWRSRNPDLHDKDEHGNEGELLTRRERILNKVPEEFKVRVDLSDELKRLVEKFNATHSDQHVSTGPRVVPEWEAIASEASLDEYEMLVLAYRLSNISRELALRLQGSDEERKKLQAAWKRVDRTGLAKLRAVLTNGKKTLG